MFQRVFIQFLFIGLTRPDIHNRAVLCIWLSMGRAVCCISLQGKWQH